MESSLWENWTHLFCRKVSFLTDQHCRCRCVGQGMKYSYLFLWYPLFQAQWDSNVIQIGIWCAPLLPWPVILFVGGGLLVWLLKKNKTKQDWSFNYTFLYIDNIVSLHNCLFGEYGDRIYPFQLLGIKDITYAARSASLVDLHIEADRVRSC